MTRGTWMWVVLLAGAALPLHAQTAERVRLAVDGGLAGSPGSLRQAVNGPVYLESATVDADLSPAPAGLVSLGARVQIVGRISVGGTLSVARSSVGGSLRGTVPHPFYFGAPRTLEGTIDDLRRREVAVHAEAAWTVPLRTHLNLVVFGGPSFFLLRQDLLEAPRYTERFPYDAVVPAGATLVPARGSGVGLHGGLELAWRASTHVGVAALGRYARGTLRLEANPSRSADARAGGPQVSAGIRLFF